MDTMKACVLHAVDDLRYETIPYPEPDEGEVLVRVGACGVCGSDIPRVFTQGTHSFPLIPGHEFAGAVAVTGPGVEDTWLDQRVAVFPLIPCRRCACCQIGAYAQCMDYGYLGSRQNGGFAEYVRVPAWNLVPVPESLPIEEAAMAEPAAVAAHALRRAGVEPGGTVLIFGAGPIGLLLAQWARAWGAGHVMLADVDLGRLRYAKELGFGHLIDPAAGDVAEWVLHKTGQGAAVVVEGSGSSAAYEQAMHAARPFGTVVLMGNPTGSMALSQQGYWAILRKELRVLGTWNSSYTELPINEWRLALEAMADGTIKAGGLITHRTSLSRLHERLAMMRDKTEFFNKVMYVAETGDE